MTDFTVDFGPVTQLQYNKAGPNDDVYVVTKGGLGSIGLLSADAMDNKIKFIFAAAGVPGNRRQQGRRRPISSALRRERRCRRRPMVERRASQGC